jgi:DNA-directed RNA polymerase subunit L
MNIKEINYDKSEGTINDHLEILISNSNTIFINTIRRICLDDIPYYAFHRSGINIDENTSVYDNDYMKTRLSQLPIFNVSCDYVRLDDEIKDIKKIELYITKHNTTNDILNVTTNEAKILIDDKEIEMYSKKYPILLIKLRPNESFKCHMISKLGMGEEDNIYCPVSNIYFKEIKEGIVLVLDTCGTNPYDILLRACKCLRYRLDSFMKNINLKKEKSIQLLIENEDMTICNLLNNELQENEKIDFSGVSQPDHLKKECLMKISSSHSILEIMNECIKLIINKITIFEKKIDKIKS